MNSNKQLVYDAWISVIKRVRRGQYGNLEEKLKEAFSKLEINGFEMVTEGDWIHVFSTLHNEAGELLCPEMWFPLKPFVSEKNCVIMPIYASILRSKDMVGHHPYENAKVYTEYIKKMDNGDLRKPVGYFGASRSANLLFTAYSICQPEDYKEYNPLVSQFILNYKLRELNGDIAKASAVGQSIPVSDLITVSKINVEKMDDTTNISRDGISYVFIGKGLHLFDQYCKFLKRCKRYYLGQ